MPIENIEKELSTIYRDLDKNKLVLPNFQRGFVWSKEKQKKLLASVLVDLPFGSLLILEGEAEDFTKRELCYPADLEIDHECDYVLDGQQRLSTLRTIFFDVFSEDDWTQVWNSLYGQLRTRWFLRVKPEENADEPDYFGLTRLSFETISNRTDSDIEDFIVHRVIYKTKTREPHHPAFKLIDQDGNENTNRIAIVNKQCEDFANEYLVPLWEISKGSTGIHRRVISKIADKQITQFKLDAEESSHDPEVYESLFSPIELSSEEIDSVLDEHLSDGVLGETAFATEWATLRASWVEKLAAELEQLPKRKIPVIFLNRGEVNRAVAIFEAINRGGEPLSVYDLVVAKSARDQGVKNLSTKIIEKLGQQIRIGPQLNAKFVNEHGANGVGFWLPSLMGCVSGNEPSKNLKEWFVNVLSLLAHVRDKNEECKVEHIKKEKILGLATEEVNTCFEDTIRAVVRGLAFLQLRCGVVSASDVSYKLMLVVLAYYLSDDEVWTNQSKLNKLEYWYWSSLLGGSYYTRQNEQCVEDIKDLEVFLSGGANRFLTRVNYLLDYQDYATKDILLRSDPEAGVEQSSVRRAILQYVLSKCPADFVEPADLTSPPTISAWQISAQQIVHEIHHLIPLGHVAKLGQATKELRDNSEHMLNSPLNLVYISKDANRALRDKTPSEYLGLLQNMAGATNFIPDMQKFQDAFTSRDYSDVLEQRFQLLKSSMANHLHSLL